MEWYWWVLIVIGAAIIGYFKLKIFKVIQEKKEKASAIEEED